MTTPYMSLDWPVPGITAGPTYAQMHETAVDLIDAHDHSPGKGAPVPSTGLNINADLAFGGYDATALRMARFNNQSSGLSASLVRGIYVLSGELHFIDGSGNDVALTSGGSVAGATGNISGLASPAAATWDSVNKIFAFTQNSNFPAKLQGGDLIIYETVSAPSNAVTIKSPSSLGAAYSITLPSAVPATNALLYGTTGTTLTFLAAPGAATSLLQSTTGGALSWVTTLPSGLAATDMTLTTPTFSGAIAGTYTLGGTPTITGAIIAITTMTVTSWPSFSAYNGSNQSISHFTFTKLQFPTEEYDTNSNFDSATNYRFTPTAAGKYHFSGRIAITPSASDTYQSCHIILYKNGSAYKRGAAVDVYPATGSGTNSIGSVVSVDADANGTTDYFELYVLQENSSSASRNTFGGQQFAYFTACRIG